MLDGLFGGIWKHHPPRLAAVVAAPQSRASCVDAPGIVRIEGEGDDARTQIEHAPRLAAIQRNVAPGHVAVFHDNGRIMWADGGGNHGSTAAGADDLPRIEARRRSGRLRGGSDRQEEGSNRDEEVPFHMRPHVLRKPAFNIDSCRLYAFHSGYCLIFLAHASIRGKKRKSTSQFQEMEANRGFSVGEINACYLTLKANLRPSPMNAIAPGSIRRNVLGSGTAPIIVPEGFEGS